ncbi:MAG TPA: GNAT family N-acetyltransferase [Pyrinomonadaceae bacterium]|nr:GNAT family N-acetyltransferase [Pyrinomonadaceae bacterium]
MSDDIQIKQFELSEQDALLSFLRKSYPDEPRKSDPGYWKWHYLENPNTSPEDVPLWVLKNGREVVGQLATLPVQLKVGHQTTRAIWILDFIVGENYRGQGFGKRLVLAAREWCSTMITLGINEQSTAVFRSLKWVFLGGLNRYHKLLFPGHAVGDIARVGPARALANFSYSLSRRRLARGFPVNDEAIRPLETLDGSIDDLWRRASTQWPCAVARESRFLDWQFRRQPGKQFEVLGYYRGDLLLGYAVLFFRKPEFGGVYPKAAITDLCFQAEDADEVIEGLVAAAVTRALHLRVGSLVIDVLEPRVEARLKHLGFWRIKNSPRFMASVNERQEIVYNPDNWFLTRADSDVSIFEQANV